MRIKDRPTGGAPAHAQHVHCRRRDARHCATRCRCRAARKRRVPSVPCCTLSSSCRPSPSSRRPSPSSCRPSPSSCHMSPCCPLPSSCRPLMFRPLPLSCHSSSLSCRLSPCCPSPLSCRPSPSSCLPSPSSCRVVVPPVTFCVPCQPIRGIRPNQGTVVSPMMYMERGPLDM